jgi:hypothetical protein
MIELDFNPQIGEQVEILGQDDLYEVVGRQSSADGQIYLKLKRLKDGRLLGHIHHLSVDYPFDEQIRRKLPDILAQCRTIPEELQECRFDVKNEEMYDGTPRVMVYFYLKPEIVPSMEKARILNIFYSWLREQIQSEIGSGPWLQFATKEDRSVLLAAS